MRGFVAGFLGLALAAALNGGMSWHVHEYEDHDHPEHHHGLATHHHESYARPEDASLHVESCEPGQHVVRLTFVCSTARQIDGLNVELATSGSPILLILLDQTVRLLEVRVHGPPQETYASLRAPPSYPRLII